MPEVAFSLKTVHRMLPLVGRIVNDIQEGHQALQRLEPEQARLDRQKRTLDWPARQRRYQLQEDALQLERGLSGAREELNGLGVVLLDEDLGRVGFPTMVNNRRAFFSWQLGEHGLHSWHFAEETACRPIPTAWLKELSLAGN
ncbi:MAG: DUF2203 domain-containing protein [Gemmataceae bacterium]|nr:DUF2203 domain-containing protein [Gemmataceae bacterium]